MTFNCKDWSTHTRGIHRLAISSLPPAFPAVSLRCAPSLARKTQLPNGILLFSTARSTLDENVSASFFIEASPCARNNITPSRNDYSFRADAGSYTLLKNLRVRRMPYASKTLCPRVSSFYFWCSMFYLVLQIAYMPQPTSTVGVIRSHPSCRLSAQHVEKRNRISILSPSSRSTPCLFCRHTGGSTHSRVRALRSWAGVELSLFLPTATQFPHNRCLPCQDFKKLAAEHQYTPLKCALPGKICRKKTATYRRKHVVQKATSFLTLPSGTYPLARQMGKWSYSLLRLLISRQSRQRAIASTATATDQQSRNQEALQRQQTAETRKKELFGSSGSVRRWAQGQFPFAYDGDPSVVLKALSSEPAEAAGKPLLHGNGKKSFIYFDNAATTQKPWGVLQALQRTYIHENANVHRSTYSRAAAATERLEGVRSKLAGYLNAERPEEIVFTSGATDSINLVAGSWGDANICEGDEIVLSVAEHHSNIVPWQLLARRKKASLRYIQLDEQHLLSVPSLLSSLSPRTKLVALSHTSNVLGSFNPYVREVVRLIKQFNPSIVVLLDASQALAHHKLDVRDLLCDFLAGSGHKMYGPTGVGFLYGRHRLLQEMPPWKGGGEMIAVQRNSSTYADPPARFEAGTPPFVQVAGLGAALDFVEQVGLREIVAYESNLHKVLRSALEAYVPSLRLFCPPAFPSPPPQLSSNVLSSGAFRKLEPLPPVPLVSFVHPFVHAQDIATFLDVCDEIYIRSGHHCCQLLHREALRVPATCRASLAVYNTEEEVHRFVKSVQSVIFMLERQTLGTSHATTESDHLHPSEGLPQPESLSLSSE